MADAGPEVSAGEMVSMNRRGFLGSLVALAVAPKVRDERACFLPGDRVKFSENGYSYLVQAVTTSSNGQQEIVISRIPIGGLRRFGGFRNLKAPSFGKGGIVPKIC